MVELAFAFFLKTIRLESSIRELDFLDRRAEDRVFADLHESLQTRACVDEIDVFEPKPGKLLRSREMNALGLASKAESDEIILLKVRVAADLGD